MVPLVLLLSVPVLMGLLLWRYIMLAYPSAETFHCDGVTLTLSQVRWLDVHNKRWDTRSYPLAEIAEMKYQAIARASPLGDPPALPGRQQKFDNSGSVLLPSKKKLAVNITAGSL